MLILTALLSAGALLYITSLSAQRRALSTANASSTRYAAEAALQAMDVELLDAAQVGAITPANVLAIDSVVKPVIGGIRFPEWSATRAVTGPTSIESVGADGALIGMSRWLTDVTLTVTAQSTAGGKTRLSQAFQMEAVPFFQAALTALGDAEIVTQDSVAQVLVEGTTTRSAAAAYRGGSLWIYTPSQTTIDGGVAIFGFPYLRRKDTPGVTVARNGGVVNTYRDGVTARAFPWDAIDAVSGGYNVATTVAAAHSGIGAWVFTTRPLPVSPTLPPCQGAANPGLFGLRCRSGYTATIDTLDVSTLTTASAPNGILHLVPATAGGSVAIKNAQTFPKNMTLISDSPLLINGDVNTVSSVGVALISPRLYVEKPTVGGTTVTIRAVLIGGYQISSTALYRGGFTSALPAVRDLDWGAGTVPDPKRTVYVYGAVIGVPVTTGRYAPTPIHDPHRIYRYDPALLDPANWPPGVFGRITLRPPQTRALDIP